MTSPDDRSERARAGLALALSPRGAPGERPSPEEIADWHAGRLPPARAAEVKAHVARDPACYRQWHQLRLAEHRLAAEARAGAGAPLPARAGRIAAWWRALPTGGMAAAAVAVAFVTLLSLPLLRAPDLAGEVDARIGAWDFEPGPAAAWPWAGRPTLKSAGAGDPRLAPMDQDELVTFRAGVRAALGRLAAGQTGWEAVLAELPPAVAACATERDDGSCAQRRENLFQLGRLSALVYLTCTAGEPARSVSLEPERELLLALARELHSDPRAGRFTARLGPWVAQPGDREALCAGIRGLMRRAM